MGEPIPNTLMWGTTQLVQLPAGVPSQPSQQLVRIEHDRPQSWSFLFTVEIPSPLSTPSTDVRFDVTAGLGRTAVTIAMATLRAQSSGGVVWTCSAFSIGLLDPITGNPVSEIVQAIPAQQINCQATIINAPPSGGQIIVGAFFAPLSFTQWNPSDMGSAAAPPELPWPGRK